jgi:WD40 repeat protein
MKLCYTLKFFLVAIGDHNGAILVYDSNYALSSSFQAHTDQIIRIKSLPNGYIATIAYDYTVKIWNPLNNIYWTLLQTYRGHSSSYVGDLAYINSDTVATGGVFDGVIQIWSLSTLITLKRISTGSYIFSLQLLSNGIYLAAGVYYYGQLNIYNINDGSLVSSYSGHSNTIYDFALIGNNLFASASSDSTIRIWNTTSNSSKFILTGHGSGVQGLKMISSDTLASGSYDNTVKLWNITSGSLIRTFTGHSSSIYFSVDLLSPQILASGSYDQTIKLWNISSGQVLNTINTGKRIMSLAVVNLIQGKINLNPF